MKKYCTPLIKYWLNKSAYLTTVLRSFTRVYEISLLHHFYLKFFFIFVCIYVLQFFTIFFFQCMIFVHILHAFDLYNVWRLLVGIGCWRSLLVVGWYFWLLDDAVTALFSDYSFGCPALTCTNCFYFLQIASSPFFFYVHTILGI